MESISYDNLTLSYFILLVHNIEYDKMIYSSVNEELLKYETFKNKSKYYFGFYVVETIRELADNDDATPLNL